MASYLNSLVEVLAWDNRVEVSRDKPRNVFEEIVEHLVESLIQI
jgi:hypothetical protein